jgi:hypothetical protein
VGLALLLVILTGCDGDEDDTRGPSYPPSSSDATREGSSSPPTAFPIYRVPDTECPSNYGTGLLITTDSAAEVEYLDDIVACTTLTGTATYLKNDSDAVWTFHNRGSTPGRVQPWNEELVASSFRSIVGPQRALMVPRAVVTVNLPPEEFSWDIDLPLSVSWEGHELVAEKIKSAGQEAFVAALRRKSPAGAALVACTLGVDGVARGVPELEDADFSGVVLTGLGVATTTNKCRQAAVRAPVVDETGRVVTLSDELGRLERQTATLARVETRLSYVARGFKVLKLGIKFVR